jgi:sideroflexin-1/3
MSTGSDAIINLDSPRWDQSTYTNRAKHFFLTTNPFNVLASDAELTKAKQIVETYRIDRKIPQNMTVDDLWNAKYLMDSAYHPDTKEKMFLPGRMSAQVPCNVLITGGMLTFYSTTSGTILWQVINQSFNALVNYTNRSGDAPISKQQLGTSFAIATSSATLTALGLNALAKKMPPIAGRFVPFVAVAAANCFNLPFMRNTEITQGIQLVDDKGNKVAESPKTGKKAITQVSDFQKIMQEEGRGRFFWDQILLDPFLFFFEFFFV